VSVYVQHLLLFRKNVNPLMFRLNGEPKISVVSDRKNLLKSIFDVFYLAMQCEYGKIYMACGPVCQPTCRDIHLNDNYHCMESGCQEGCFCPENQVMDATGTCVVPQECPCIDQNLAYPVGSKIIRNCDGWLV
jgi:hypothetical protein